MTVSNHETTFSKERRCYYNGQGNKFFWVVPCLVSVGQFRGKGKMNMKNVIVFPSDSFKGKSFCYFFDHEGRVFNSLID
jgi:hypothetical protein